MAVDEGSRQRLYRKLDKVLGSEDASTLMALLPPAGFDHSRLATKEDLQTLSRELRFEWRADIERMGRRIVMWTSGMMVALAGLAFAAGRFL